MAVARCLVAAIVGGVLWTAPAGAQGPAGPTGSVAGTVVDSASQQPLSDVSVRIAGTTRGALTRNDGTFLIPGVPAGAQTVRFNRIGYGLQTRPVTVNAGSTVNVGSVALNAQAAVLSEVVTVGYGTQRREAITGAVANIKAEEANVGVIPNANAMLSARVAGVQVVQNNGEPGAGAQIRVRGGTSISASNEPLYVVDGVPLQNNSTEPGGIGIGGGAALSRSPLNAINPNDIASITVLKDASATAIYGSRGANGVILIETKKGAGATAGVEYDGYAATSTPSRKLEFLTGAEYRNFIQQQVSAGVLAQDRLQGLGTANTDWEDELTRMGVSQNHNVAFFGGSSATTYRASLNFFDQNGVVISSGFQRYQGRLNAQHQAFGGKLQLGLNLTASRLNNDYLPFENTGGFEGGVFVNQAVFNPTRPVEVTDPTTGVTTFYEIGAGSQSVRNPVALANQINDRGRTDRTLGNVTASYALLPSLTARVTTGIDRSNGLRRVFFPRSNPVGAATNGLARQEELDLQNLNFQSLLTWSPEFGGEQEFEVVGGYEFTDFDNGGFGATVRGFSTDAFGFNNLGGGNKNASDLPFSWREESRLVSFFSRANYGFKNRYFLTGVLRYDGSSRLAEGNKWSTFPAVSASWRLSDESFFPTGMFSNLALRAGWGLQGNQAVAPYATQILLTANTGASYPFGGVVRTGVVATRNENPDLKWETSQQVNIGLDYGVWNNRVTGVLDFYVKNTRDLLLEVAVPQPAFVANRFENIGRVRNTGFEGTLDAQLLNQQNRSFTAGLIFSVERNEVVDLGGDRQFIVTGSVSGQGQSGQNSQRIIPGQPLGTFYGPQYVGVDGEGKQLFNKYTVTRDAQGRETGRTLNGTTTSPTGDDLTVIGDANPAFSLGLRSNATWGRFDASWLWRGEFGRDVFNNTGLVYGTKGNALQEKNFLKDALSDPIGIREPAIYSSRWIEDASFVRLQNVTVGYRFDRLPGALRTLRSTRVYVAGDNLLLFTPYSGYDPEVFVDAGLATRGIDYLVYPRARTFTAGASIQF
jgi:TonB-dependent starch-binding outer membrane protein SusC